MQSKIGLIAGNGRFPILFAKAAKKKGLEVVAICINEETSKELERYVDKNYWVGAGELKRFFQILREEKLSSVLMAGQVKHKLLFDNNVKIDDSMSELLANVSDKKTDSLIGAIAARLEKIGIKLLDSTTFLSDYLPKKGLLTDCPLDKRTSDDIEFGKSIAKSIAGLDIGQTVAVKDKAILAVESIEGTDETIRRGSKYGKEDIVIVKVSKPNQDMRFDVPIIGPDTIRLLKELKAGCIAIEAEKTLIIDKEETIALANKAGISILAF